MNTQAIQRALTDDKTFSLSLFMFCFSLVLLGRYIDKNEKPDPGFRGRYRSVKERVRTVVENGKVTSPNQPLYVGAFCSASFFLTVFASLGVTDGVVLCLTSFIGGIMGFGYAIGFTESEFVYGPSNAVRFRQCSQYNLVDNITDKLHVTDHQKGVCKGAGIVWSTYVKSSRDFVAKINQKNIQDIELLKAVYARQAMMLPYNINNARSSIPTVNKDYRVYQLTNTVAYSVDLAVANPNVLIFIVIDCVEKSHAILLQATHENNKLVLMLYDSSSYEAIFHDEIDAIKSLLSLIRIKYIAYFNKQSFEIRVQSESPDARIHRDVESSFYRKLGKVGLLTGYQDFTNAVPMLRESHFMTPRMG